MTIFKSSILALGALCAVAFTACSDDNEYQPANVPVGLYFPESPATTYEIPKDETTFTVAVDRSGLTEAASYAVTVVTAEENLSIFTLPTQAVFTEGSTSGTLTFTYDPSKLDPEATYDFSVALADGTPACVFGDTTFDFSAVLRTHGPWQKFDKEGVGTYTYNWFMEMMMETGTDPGLPVQVRYNEDNPEMAQVRIQHWGIDQDFVINYNTKTGYCTVPVINTTMDLSLGDQGVFTVYATDIYTYAKSGGYCGYDTSNPEVFADASYYDPETGTFQLYMVYFIQDGGNWGTLQAGNDETLGYEAFQLDGYKNYDLTLAYTGVFTDTDEESSAIITATVSDEASACRVLMRKNAVSPDAVLDELLNGAADAVSVRPGAKEETVQLPLNGVGTYTVVGVTYEGSEPMKATSVTFEVAGGVAEDPNEGWHNVGVAEICDAWVLAGFTFTSSDPTVPAPTYKTLVWSVDLQESDDTPGLYRLVNPWLSPDCILNVSLGGGDPMNANTKKTNVLIDATNKNCVVIAPQYSGFTYIEGREELPFYIANFDGYALSDIFAEQNELAPGTITKQDIIDGTLFTIPATPFDDGAIAVTLPVYGFGLDADNFGYSLKSEPEGYVFMDFTGQAKSPRKIAKEMNIRQVTKANYEAKARVRFACANLTKATKAAPTFKKAERGIRAIPTGKLHF